MQAVAWYTLFLTMDEHEPTQPFFLIVIDEDRGVFSVEGPMTDGRPWQSAARKARKDARHVVCGPAGAERDTIAAVFRRERKLAGVPPGSIARPVG
jgi:hypothetical protein